MRTLGVSRLRPEAIAEACARYVPLELAKKQRLFGYFRSWELRGSVEGLRVAVVPCPSRYADFLVRVWYPAGPVGDARLAEALRQQEPLAVALRAERVDNRIEFVELGVDVPPKSPEAGRVLAEAVRALVGLVRHMSG